MKPPSRWFRVVVHVGLLAGIAFAIAANVVVARTALAQPTRTFLPTLALTAGLAYAVGRGRPFRRVYERLDDANDRALRGWREGDRLWRVAAAYAFLHPVWFVRGWWRHTRKARAERLERERLEIGS